MFDALLQALAEMVARDTSADMIDSTVVRAHHCAVGQKKRGSRGPGARPVARRLRHQAPRSLRRTRPAARLRSDARSGARCAELWPIIPTVSKRCPPTRATTSMLSAQSLPLPKLRRSSLPAAIAGSLSCTIVRNTACAIVERLFSKLKNWRRVDTRYHKTRESYLGFVSLASVFLWLPFVHDA